MCPEPDFGMEYYRLIQSYRLAPDISVRQLERILDRFYQKKTGSLPCPDQRKGGEAR